MGKIRKISLILVFIVVLIGKNQAFAESTKEGWKFIVEANDTYLATDTLENLTLAETCDEATLINGTIAPGVTGSFSITVETDDLGAAYDIIFDNFSSNFPKNLVFTVDDEIYDIHTGFHNQLNGEGTAKHTVNWYWDYDGEDEFNKEADTNITFDIRVKAEQVNERAISDTELETEKETETKSEIIRDVLPKTGF